MPAAVHALEIALRNLSPPKPWKTRRSGTRSSRGQRSSTARKTVGVILTQRAFPVFDTFAETRTFGRYWR